MNIDKHISERAKRLHNSVHRQTSTPVSGLINLGSGAPDFVPPAHVIAAMHHALDAGQVKYTAWAGIPELRAAVADKLRRENGFEVDPAHEVLITGGAQESLTIALMALLDPGDQVLIPSPHYDEYTRDVAMLDSALVPVVSTPECSFALDAAQLEAAITPRTKAIVIISPNNPTGAVIAEPTLREVARLAQAHDLVVISDEIYEYYVYDDARHISMASLPGMRERTITINSFSKSCGMTGLRLGFMAANADLIHAMLPFHHGMMICAPSVSQYGGLAALTHPRDWFTPILAEYDRRRHLWMETLDQIGLPYCKPQGAYYVFIDIRPTGLSSAEFVERAHDDARLIFQTGTINGSAGEGFVRASLTLPSPKFDEGLERLQDFVRERV